MAKTTIFIFHPDLSQSTINLRLAQAAEGLEGVEIRDMYALYPDFNFDVEAEQDLLERTDRIVLQFPIQWYSSPPLLKKWEDDVLTWGWAYGTNGDALQGKELLLAVSAGAVAAHYRRFDTRRSVTDVLFRRRRRDRDAASSGYTMNDVLRPFQATSVIIGTDYLEPFVTPGATTMHTADLEARAKAYARYVTSRKLRILDTYQ
ncbi:MULTISPECIES: NAD(P)H-dependent oxidoreductase [Actinomyces]|uniref:Flavodoxin-like fold domain-containing protein n=2 Tax=Actinomyces TaxID=1654 RepID=A0A1M4S0T3_9ACTO|nr:MULTISPECIES: NAD(P)H-dependent oxidoreductase [Actinomyces]PHP53079.1 NAD(P)H oxidoreductase [Actinomyces ruminis]RAX23735.1 flavodoxin family protein [Actinomyces sp. Z3]SHE25740.1 Hypothetical protein ACGLYG10_1976 [Actinomyces glycerinitolerans]